MRTTRQTRAESVRKTKTAERKRTQRLFSIDKTESLFSKKTLPGNHILILRVCQSKEKGLTGESVCGNFFH